MRSAVIIFPGSNCDRDMTVALHDIIGKPPLRVWHGETSLPADVDFVALPGGFSYGDYLRPGAMAVHSPIMSAVAHAAKRGVPILGVCNGFQLLSEARLLPGALTRNVGINFICRTVPLVVENSQTLFTAGYRAGETIRIPIAHHDGNYCAPPDLHQQLEDEGRIVFRYGESVNGSVGDIAGIVNKAGNVLGLMPHPERACDPAHGTQDGRRLFESALGALV